MSRVKEMLLHVDVDGLNSIRQCFTQFSIDLRYLVRCRHRLVF